MDVETSVALERVADRIERLEVSVHDGLAENRRHAEILCETLRDDIRILAEGFATISTKLDSLQR